MPQATHSDLTTLFIHFLDVCNTALTVHQDKFPYKQLLAVSEKLFGGKNVAVRIYDDDPGRPIGTVTIRFRDRRFEPVSEGEEDPTFRLKVKRAYLRQVVSNRQEYIDHPEKLDWDWLKTRFGKSTGEANGTVTVGEVMTPGIETITRETPVRLAAEKMKQLDIGALPVVDGTTPIGFVTDRDIAVRSVACGMHPEETPVHEVMTLGIVSCGEETDIRDAAQTMEERKVRRLLVLGADHKPVGIVSIGDLAARSLNEQMVGRVMSSVAASELAPLE